MSDLFMKMNCESCKDDFYGRYEKKGAVRHCSKCCDRILREKNFEKATKRRLKLTIQRFFIF